MILKGQKVKPPCGKSCTRRTVGCHASCPEWAAYVAERDKDYENRADIIRINDAIHDGYDRLEKLGRSK